ncbi:hypothetical protein LXL04_021419 [Taraxacum kok-saghyz]
MQTVCFNSNVTLGSRHILSLPFNHTSYMFDEMSERSRIISSSRKCCCCYSAANISMCNRLIAISPCFRQSTLYQWSLTKTLLFHGTSSRGFYTVSSFTDRNYHHEKLSSFNEKRKQRAFGHKRKKQFLCNASDDYVNDVEVMLSLLTDEVNLDPKKIDKKQIICNNKEKKNICSGIVNKDPKCNNEKGKISEKKDIEKGYRNKSEKKLIEEVSSLNCEEISTEVSNTIKEMNKEKHQKTNHLNFTTTVSNEKSQVHDSDITNIENSSHECELKGPSDEMWHVSNTSSSSENGKFNEWEDEMFMREALLEAKKAADMLEVPVGALLVHRGQIISRGYNLVEELRDSTAHAEMICIREASKKLKSWRLSDTTLYVTLEPCPMCAGAILQARIGTVVWGAPNKLLGADGSWIRLFSDGDDQGTDKPPAPLHPFHRNMVVRRGVLAAESAGIMQRFFRSRRNKKTEPESLIPPEPESPIPSEPESLIPVYRHHSSFLSKMRHAFKIIFCL